MRTIRGWFKTPATQGQFIILAVTVLIVVILFDVYLDARRAASDTKFKHLDQGICLAINHIDTHPSQDPPFVVQIRADINCPPPLGTQ